VERTSGGNLRITMADAFGGASCQFRGNVVSGSNTNITGRVHGITVAGLPTGFTAQLAPDVRGLVVPPNGSGPVPVDFIITTATDIEDGLTGTIDAAWSCVEVVPQSQYTP
jgi:hypothetical protein